MKISLLIDGLGAGGAQRQLVGLACLLQEAKYEVEVVTYYDMDFYKKILLDRNIPHIYVNRARNKFLRIFCIGKYLQKSKPQVVIAYQSTPALIASFIHLFNHSFKLIVSERNTTQVYSNKEWLRFNLYRFSDSVVPNSYSQEFFIKKYAPFLVPKVKVITNFVDLNMFAPPNVCDMRMDSNVLSILTYARITPQKNIINYLYALKQVTDYGIKVKVDWFGYKDGDGSYYEMCKEKIKELGLREIFHFHDPVTDVITGYLKCNVFCLPSLFEGTPNVVCEAMSCGVPILCSDVCDNSMLIKNNINGYLFDPNDINDIASTIIRFAELSVIEKKEMSKASRKIAEEKFSSVCFLAKYKSLIEKNNV